MSRYHSYLNSSKRILQQYKGEEPFASFLKKFFSLQKKYGSKDRKQIAHLCYCYFRLGKALAEIPIQEKILIALFLCSTESNEILANLKPEWNVVIHHSFEEKVEILSPPVSLLIVQQIFPWKNELSDEIHYETFSKSFLIQPNLYLRVRPGYETQVKEKILNAGYIEVVGSWESRVGSEKRMRLVTENCIALPNASKVDHLIELDREAVVQDYSSQQIAEFLQLVKQNTSGQLKVWDCCAASGGKSILAKDILGNIDLTVSDIRETILVNLKKRFQVAGITNYKSSVINLAASAAPSDNPPRGRPKDSQLPTPDSQLIICDAPCTGSGTWSRTPEQLYFFDDASIKKYNLLQRKIVSNVLPGLKKNGYFLYITCSVFKEENEEMVAFIKEEFHLKLLKMELLKGYDQQADTLFAGLFIASEV